MFVDKLLSSLDTIKACGRNRDSSDTDKKFDSKTNKRRTSKASLIAAAQNAFDKTDLDRTTTTVLKFNSIAEPLNRGVGPAGATCAQIARPELITAPVADHTL